MGPVDAVRDTGSFDGFAGLRLLRPCRFLDPCPCLGLRHLVRRFGRQVLGRLCVGLSFGG
ncbi:hypothetical protein [Streptomyces prunicolor]|uniref:hypothetical protein n=1 Tax=Streptomyces prunicolor TaxID=67348 RepID=UPI0033F1C3D8